MEAIGKIISKEKSYQGLREHAERGKRREPGSIATDHPVWDVWQSIKSAYPGPTMRWDDEPPIEWAYALDGLTGEQIASGLRAMVQQGGTFPPSAPEFRSLCGFQDWEHRRQSKPAHEVLSAPIIDRGEGRALPGPQSGPKSGEEFFAMVNEMNWGRS